MDDAAIDWLTERLLEALARDESITPVATTLLLRRYVATGRDDLRDAVGRALARALDAFGSAHETGDPARAPEGREAADLQGPPYMASQASHWLALFVEAFAVSEDDRLRPAVDALVAALRGGWPSRGDIAPAMRSVDACLSAASFENANALVSAAIDELERVVGLAYEPGEGLAHAIHEPSREPGDPGDHVAAISALLTAHAVTGRLPYSMLAEELMQFARHAWWDGERGGFRARTPNVERRTDNAEFVANCEAARVLCRLAALHEDADYRRAAVIAHESDYADDAKRTLESLGLSYRDQGLDAAAYGIALGEYLGFR